jgi:hypothetical protein
MTSLKQRRFSMSTEIGGTTNMSKINELRQKRGEAWDKAKAFAKEHWDTCEPPAGSGCMAYGVARLTEGSAYA